MKAIMVMFDSLNRRFLSSYGCRETLTPNFDRLAGKTAQFDQCYVGSLPCIPARRELHTGRYNFLHRSWGPLEPFDDSMPAILKANGISSHLITDHGHYWEEGGATYHTQYSSWEFIRGQEGDKWQPVIDEMEDRSPNFKEFTGLRKELYRQNLANRTAIRTEEDFPLLKTFNAGLSFLANHWDQDRWFLQIESFSPHEPFMASRNFKKMYQNAALDKTYEWPDYAPVQEDEETVDQVRKAYWASLSMCDQQLGRIIDFMDDHDMWKDTLLIVNTDHGFLLSEHGYWAKNYQPCYDELAHIPLYIWDPENPDAAGTTRDELVQTIDLPVTILNYFGIDKTADMQGCDIRSVFRNDGKLHDGVLFGVTGGHICYTDGRYVYMRAPQNLQVPLYEYTLMPTHMMWFFTHQELKTMQRHDGFSFTKGLPVMQIGTDNRINCIDSNDYLFDLENDPGQNVNLLPETDITGFEKAMKELLICSDAPESIFQRFCL